MYCLKIICKGAVDEAGRHRPNSSSSRGIEMSKAGFLAEFTDCGGPNHTPHQLFTESPLPKPKVSTGIREYAYLEAALLRACSSQ